jgi:hypothetical protein
VLRRPTFYLTHRVFNLHSAQSSTSTSRAISSLAPPPATPNHRRSPFATPSDILTHRVFSLHYPQSSTSTSATVATLATSSPHQRRVSVTAPSYHPAVPRLLIDVAVYTPSPPLPAGARSRSLYLWPPPSTIPLVPRPPISVAPIPYFSSSPHIRIHIRLHSSIARRLHRLPPRPPVLIGVVPPMQCIRTASAFRASMGASARSTSATSSYTSTPTS